MRTIIVVPCYNETARLDLTRFAAYTEFDPDVEFLFVDDGSTDNTAELLRESCHAMGERWSWLALESNQGKGEAVRRGMSLALAKGAEAVGYWDADLATPLHAIPDFVRVLETRPEVGLVVGARVHLLGRRVERHPARHYIGRTFATMVSVMLDLRVYDTMCGAKLFRAGSTVEHLLAEPFVSRWIFDVEIFARLVRERRAGRLPRVEDFVCEVPLSEWQEVQGSKLKPTDFVRALPELAMLHRRYLGRQAAQSASAAGVVRPQALPAELQVR